MGVSIERGRERRWKERCDIVYSDVDDTPYAAVI